MLQHDISYNYIIQLCRGHAFFYPKNIHVFLPHLNMPYPYSFIDDGFELRNFLKKNSDFLIKKCMYANMCPTNALETGPIKYSGRYGATLPVLYTA